MGLFACFAAPAASPSGSSDQEVANLTALLTKAKAHIADLNHQLLQLHSEQSYLQQQLSSRPSSPSKQDAATEMPTVSVGVQAQPPVNVESRIPRPTSDDPSSLLCTATAADLPAEACPSLASTLKVPLTGSVLSPLKQSRIPAHPGDSPTRSGTRSCTRSPSFKAGQLITTEVQQQAPATAAEPTSTTQGQPWPDPIRTASADLASLSAAAPGSFSKQHEQPQQQQQPEQSSPARVDVLQQQIKIAEAFRLSVEAELRDARFTNSNLQTQVLSLQTKLEKVMEDQMRELERLNQLRKEGQENHEQAVQQAHTLKRQLSKTSAAFTAAQRDAEAATKKQAALEQQLQHLTVELVGAKEELTSCMVDLARHSSEADGLRQQLQAAQDAATKAAATADERATQLEAAQDAAAHAAATADSLSKQLQEAEEAAARAAAAADERVKQEAAAREAAEQREAAIKQLEHEVKSQKAIYDSTVEEMLQLSTNYNELKQAYHKLQSETKNHDEMVHLVQQELSELSYYAAAGRVALGIAPASSLRNFTQSEVSMDSQASGSSGGVETPTTAYGAVAAVVANAERVAEGKAGIEVLPQLAVEVLPGVDVQKLVPGDAVPELLPGDAVQEGEQEDQATQAAAAEGNTGADVVAEAAEAAPVAVEGIVEVPIVPVVLSGVRGISVLDDY